MAVTNYCATVDDCKDPPFDFLPDGLYCPEADSDADCVADGYEDAHACLNALVADATADPDRDGLANLLEHRLQTNACDPEGQRRLHIWGGGRDGPSVLRATAVGEQQITGPVSVSSLLVRHGAKTKMFWKQMLYQRTWKGYLFQ